MGEVISAKAAIERTEGDIRTAFNKATARGGEVAQAAATRLGPSVAAMDSASAVWKASESAENASWEIVLVRDAAADIGIGAVRDAMWSALGRPKQSSAMDEVFPGGIGTYTSGDPIGQPVLMQILQSRILSASAPQWTAQQRQGWVAELEALRVPYAAAVDAHRPAEAALLVAEAGYRAAVRGGHARLRNFKRDLKNLGLTEKQIHEIIPDAGAGRSRGTASEVVDVVEGTGKGEEGSPK
jgi:hypothetical protein